MISMEQAFDALDRGIDSLGWIRKAIVEIPQSHESAVEIDKQEVVKRLDMITMTAQAVMNHGPLRNLIFSAQRDAALALNAAMDAQANAAWSVGQHVATALVTGAAIANGVSGTITALGQIPPSQQQQAPSR